MTEQVDICYVVSHGFAARMILDSDIIPELLEQGLRVGILSPDANEPGMMERARAAGFVAAPTPAPRRLSAMMSLRLSRYLFEDVAGNPALYAKHLWDEHSRHWWDRAAARALLPVSKLARRMPALPRGASWLQTRILRQPELAARLRALAPSVLVSTYPMNALEASALLEAERAGIRTVIQLLSWDNITSKGRFPVLADHYVSWGPVMSAELRTEYGVPSERISECGVPHFDRHVQLAPARPAHPYLFFGMSSPVFAPREIAIVEWLAQQIETDRFGADMHFVVRPHPQNVQGAMGDASWLPRLERLRSARVAVDLPRVKESKLPWSMDARDLEHLAALIGGAAVTLNSGSTIAIDGLMHDKPVILTLFDADDTSLPWYRSARRVADYRHLQKLIQLGGVRVVNGYAALAAAIDAYLARPDLDAEQRARTRRAECGNPDGLASHRVAGVLARLARGDAPLRFLQFDATSSKPKNCRGASPHGL